jgi:hypothetical protein
VEIDRRYKYEVLRHGTKKMRNGKYRAFVVLRRSGPISRFFFVKKFYLTLKRGIIDLSKYDIPYDILDELELKTNDQMHYSNHYESSSKKEIEEALFFVLRKYASDIVDEEEIKKVEKT